jgi:hypothetical protein
MRRLSERQRQVLEFIVDHTVAPKFHLEALFGPAVSFDLKKLKAMDLVRLRPFVGRFSLYQATGTGCRRAGASEARARPLGAQALQARIAVCHLVTVLGYRLLSRERAAQILHDAPPSVSFVLGLRAQESVLFRVLTPGSYTDPRAIVRSIRQLEQECDWSAFQANERGYLVTADTRARKNAISGALKRAKLYGQRFVLRTELAPSAATLEEFAHPGATETRD